MSASLMTMEDVSTSVTIYWGLPIVAVILDINLTATEGIALVCFQCITAITCICI